MKSNIFTSILRINCGNPVGTDLTPIPQCLTFCSKVEGKIELMNFNRLPCFDSLLYFHQNFPYNSIADSFYIKPSERDGKEGKLVKIVSDSHGIED